MQIVFKVLFTNLDDTKGPLRLRTTKSKNISNTDNNNTDEELTDTIMNKILKNNKTVMLDTRLSENGMTISMGNPNDAAITVYKQVHDMDK